METTLPGSNEADEKEFKSYYVVWKQKIHEYFKFGFNCLNRTMQYGNYFAIL